MMQELIMALDAKEREINEFMTMCAKERDGLMQRLSEIDTATNQADLDLRRINRARNALNGDPDPELAQAASSAAESARGLNEAAHPRSHYAPGGRLR